VDGARGPGANFALVLLAGLALRIGAMAGTFTAPEHITFGALATRRRRRGISWDAC
jgi:hypothetical protein